MFDFAACERQCELCELREAGQVLDDERCAMCRARAAEERWPEEFRAWLFELCRVWEWRARLGVPVPDDLGFAEMETLVVIDRHFEARRAEAGLMHGR